MLNLHAVIYSLIQGGWLATPSTPPGSAPELTVLLYIELSETILDQFLEISESP